MNKKSLERNIRLYPFYRAFSYDFLFIWTISVMYLTWKGLSYAEVIYLDAIFMIAAFVLQIPITKLMQKLGRSCAVKTAGLLCVGFCVIYIFSASFLWLAIANVLYGISASIKNVTDAEILSLSLKRLGRKNEFSKIEGKGIFWHYIIESIAAISSGYLYQYISPVAPIVGTLVTSIILVAISVFLVDPKNGEELEEIKLEIENEKTIKKPAIVKSKQTALSSTVYDLKSSVGDLGLEKKSKKKGLGYSVLLKDKFIIAMMVFCFCFWGIMSIYSTLAKVYYQDIGTKAWAFGYIYFIFKMITALCSKFQFKYELKRGVRSLIIFAILTILSFGLNGIMATINATSVVSILIISVMFIIQNAIRAPYRIFVKNYINICSDKESLTKALTLYSMSEYLGYAFITLVVATVMHLTNNSFALTNIIVTAIIAIPMMLSIIIFIKELIKKYAKSHTIIREDMVDEL